MLSEEKENWEISLTRIADQLVTLPIFAAFLTEEAALRAKSPITPSSDCIQAVYSLPSPFS